MTADSDGSAMVCPIRPGLLAGLVAWTVLAADGSAQEVRGTMVESDTGSPIQGAFVSLVDSADVRRASTLSDASGAYSVRAPAPGTYRVRAERIGFATTTSGRVALAAGETVRRDLSVPSTAVELQGISVSAERVCDADPGSAGELASLWNEIRKAISVADWVDDAGVLRYRVRRYTRTLDPHDPSVREDGVEQRTGFARQPFAAPEPRSLARDGYVQDWNGETLYHAPDPRALLSDGFERTHCFGIVRPDGSSGSGLVGLEFTPVEGRDVPDIRGTLWVDESSAELRHMAFSFTGLEGVRRAEDLGGRVEYRRLPTGAWVVDRWWIRMPVRGAARAWWREAGGPRNEVLAGVREVGGEVLEVSTLAGDTDLAGNRATIRGVVWDSLAAEPLAGARVFLNGTSHSTEADEAGRFALRGLSGGRYAVAFHHPRMSERDLFVPPRNVDVTPGDVRTVRLALPSKVGMAREACAEVHETTSAPPERRGVLTGVIRDAVTEEPVSGATVRVVLDGGERLEAETDAWGRYLLCTLPRDGVATVEASFLERTERIRDVRLSGDQPVVHDLDLVLTRPTTVVVRVLEEEADVPIRGAEVRLGDGAPVLTDEEGRASFPSVAPGLRGVRIEHLAYGTLVDSVLVRSAETVRLRVRMATRAVPLDRIEVDVEGDVDRGVGAPGSPTARGTRADVLTREEIEEALPRSLDTRDLLSSPELAGLTVTESSTDDGQRTLCIETSRTGTGLRGGGCKQVEVSVDDVFLSDPGGFVLSHPPREVARIEFLIPREAGAAYGTGSRNGRVLIYTRDGRRR